MKKQHGGYRENAGRHTIDPNGKRQPIPLNLSPANFKFLQNMGSGKHNWLNNLLDGVRAQINEQ